MHNFGIEIRAGLHTGEVEIIGDDVGGISVHATARIMGNARPDEVWTSRTVKDLVAGTQFKFREQGTYKLRGVLGDWPLFTVAAS
jgi:class 3 adenylate cyclase